MRQVGVGHLWCSVCGAVAARDGGLAVDLMTRTTVPPGRTAWLRPERERHAGRVVEDQATLVAAAGLARAAEESGERRERALKVGLAELDGEVKLVPQDGEVIRVPVTPGEHVWDGVDEKAHAGRRMNRRER
jgi:hypothetical protein